MNNKSLLMVNSSLSNGGSEHVMVMLANEFVKRDYDVDMLICDEKAPETYILDKRVNKIKYLSNGATGKRFSFGWLKLIRECLKKKKYTAVISFMMSNNVFTLLASIGLKQNIIVSERANPLLVSEYGFIIKAAEQILYPYANCIVFQTDEVKGYYKPSIRKKGVVIPNPVDPNILEPWDGKKKKEIVSAGRLTEQKNFPLLLKSFKKMSEQYPDYKLVIFGKGPLLDYLKNLAIDLKIDNKVEFPGFSKDVDDYIRKSEMFVLPSNYEGISNTMIESMAMGVPTICTDCPVGGARMMINNNKNGILVPVGDEDALTEAMIKIAQNPKFARNIGSEAIKIRNEYSIEKIADKWEKVINCRINEMNNG